MNFINRAIKNITRVKGRSILLMITFFILGNLVIVGLGVSQAASDAKISTRQKMRAVVRYEIDYNAIDKYVSSLETEEEREEFYNNYPRITRSKVHDLVNLDDRILAVNYIQSVTLYSDGFDAIKIENNNSGGGGIITYDDGSTSEWVEPNLSMKGNIFPNMIEFEEGSFTILDGRMYTQEEIDSAANVVLVEQGLAELNGFRVGDRISVKTMQESDLAYYNGYIEVSDITMELEIIGIYDNAQVLDPNDPDYQYLPSYLAPENAILMPTTVYVANQMNISQKMIGFYQEQYPGETWYENQQSEDDYYYGSVVILLNDPLEVEDFVADNQAAIGEFFKFDADLDTFNKLSRPLDAMARFADILVGIIIVNALVIVTLITALTLKNREYEIGVLLAMGVSKIKVIGQMFMELVIVGLLGFTLSIASGALVSGAIGDWMLDAQLSTELDVEDNDNNWGGWYNEDDYFTDITQDDLLSEYKVSVKPVMIAAIYGGGLLVIFVSVLIPGLMVMRYNPKQILTNVR